MARFDFLKSLARSAARSASGRLGATQLTEHLRRRVEKLSLLQTSLSDAQLTRAVGRSMGVAAATVRIDGGGVRVQVTDEAGRDTSMTLWPGKVSFAPQGAKEVSFSVEPPELAERSVAIDIVGAIAGEVARTLWGPFLAGAQRRGNRRNSHATFVHRAGPLLTADLRSVPEVRAVLGQRLPATLLDALRLEALHTMPGALRLQLGLHR
ncbi:MAG: hypothetical protein OXU20_24705 [Myxococcales bacterium]|nr:hypothetical protein [Myxococcales bacterium]